ncbi:MAG: hypothetical protein HDT38_05685 [Clostridiales bacterium]|nr:hypothetical protein [Clostridiales bacterium]
MEWVFTSVFLILVVLALRAALGKRVSAGLRYSLWAVVLLRLLVPVQLFTSPIAGTRVFSQTRTEQNIYNVTDNGLEKGGEDDILALGVPDGPSVAITAFPQAPAAPALPEAPEPPAAPDLTKAPVWLGWTWLAGAAAAVLVLLLSNLRFFWKLRRERVPRDGADCPLRVYAAAGLPSPCLFGLFRPAIYVTPEAAADPAMLRHVLAHEYTHYRHGDHIWSLLRCGALAAHWWNPLVWLAVVLSRRDGELACDEGALKRLGDGERLAYGNTLLALVTAKPHPGDLLCFATTMTGDKKSLKERIGRIACAPKRWLWAAVAVVLVTVLACACAFGQAAEEREEEPSPTAGQGQDWENSPIWPYGVSEMVYIRDAGGFGGDFSIRLIHDGSFVYYEGYLSSYIGMGTWTRDGDVICLADTVGEDVDRIGIKYYYFRMDGGDLVFQAENSDRFMYLDVADGERFSRKLSGTDGNTEERLARFAAVDHLTDIPWDVVEAAEGFVQNSYEEWRGDVSLTGTARFDDWRVTSLEGPWHDVTESAELEIWRINYELHTSTPNRVKVMSGMALSEDGWFRPNYPDSRYLLFTVQDGKRAYLTDINETEYQPGSERFHADLERMAARTVTPDNVPATDLNRNGMPEAVQVTAVADRQQLEVWEDGKVIWQDEGYFAHMGWNAVFLCTLDGEDYLLRYNPYMGQGWCTYSYQLFTLSKDGTEQTARENSVSFDVNFYALEHDSFDPSAIAGFMSDVNSLLAHSVQLLNTNEDLLDTFRKNGRLYDSLGWLDWEEAFVRDENKSLLENLQAYKAAMDARSYAEMPQVRTMDELGKHMLLTYRDKQTQFDGQWEEQFQPNPEPQVLDLNGDGRNEIVLILVEAHGTGCLIENLYIFDADTLKQYDTTDLTGQLIGQVKSTGDDQYFCLTAPGMERAAVPKDAAGVGPTPKAIELGNIVEYTLKDGVLCCHLGCDASGRALEYCGEIQATLTMDRQGRVSASSFAYVPYERYEAGSPMEKAHQQYRDVLLGVKPFTYTASGQTSKRVYASNIPELFPYGNDGYTAADKFAAVDLDGDEIPEPVIQVIAVAGDAGGFLVLDQRGGSVYGLKTSYRTFWDLKKDGTFTYSEPTGLESGAAALDVGTGQLVKRFYSVLDPAADRYSYYVDGKETSQKEYEAAKAQQEGKPDAIWYAFNSTNVRAVFS